MAATELVEAEDRVSALSAFVGKSAAEQNWAATALVVRLGFLKRARHGLAAAADELVDALPGLPVRTRADSLASEVLPLLEACRFLEREAKGILRTRVLGRRGLPFWLSGLDSRVERVALGRVLIVGPANYPLLLPGVQALQALAAGNGVVWKPGRGGAAVARVVARVLDAAGLPAALLRVTGESADEVLVEMNAGPDKVIFTGSATAGRAVCGLAAERGIAVVAELSGCDAVVALPSVNVERLAAALAFGMRLNGSATCMAPRRLFLVGDAPAGLIERVVARLAEVRAVPLARAVEAQLAEDLDEARGLGATVVGRERAGGPVLVLDARPEMRIARADVFAPVLSVLRVRDEAALVEAYEGCPWCLTVAVFGDEKAARQVGAKLCAGTVLINDLIVPTADPRVPFGGRRASGWGVTRGAEGLLEMTAVKTVLARRGRSQRHFAPTGAAHEQLFKGVAGWQHGGGWRVRVAGLKTMMKAVKEMR